MCFALIASTVFFALRAEGREGTETTSNDGGAWLVNGRAGSIGHANREVRELSTALRIGGAPGDLDIYQPEDAIVAHDRTSATLSVLDARTQQLVNTIEVPRGAEIVRHEGGLVIRTAEPFRIWDVNSVALAEINDLEGVAPVFEGSRTVSSVSATGGVLVVDPIAGELVLTVEGRQTRVALPPELAVVEAVVFDGDVALVFGGGRIGRLVDDELKVLDAAGFAIDVVGLPSVERTGTAVVIDDQSRIVRIFTDTGQTQVLGTLAGRDPVEPIEHAGCVYALANRPPQFWVVCEGQSPTVTPLPVEGAAQLRLRLVNGWVWINDVATGNFWTVDEQNELSVVDDWGAVLPSAADDQDLEALETTASEDDLVDDIEDPDAADAETVNADSFDDDGENEPPVAEPDEGFQTHQDRPIVIDVVANDTDPDNDVLLISAVENLSVGDALVSATSDGRRLQVTPAAGFTGTITFRYTISDGRGGFDSAVGSVQVERRTAAQNRSPIAVTDVTTVSAGERAIIEVLSNDFDPDGDSLVVVAASAPEGTVTFDPGGRLVYVADLSSDEGEVELSYTIADEFGAEATGRVRAQVRLPDSNQPPDARNDGGVTVVGQPLTLNLLANDTDPDGDDLFVGERPVQLSGPTEAFHTSSPDGEFVFIPDEAGTYVFRYAVSDNQDSDVAQIRIEVGEAQQNRPPVAVRDDIVIPFGESRIVHALANDGDPDGDVVGIVDFDVPPGTGMRVELHDDSGFRVFIDGPGPSRRTFSYTISDGKSDPVGTTVVVAVIEAEVQNQPPVAQADTVEVRPGSVVAVDVLVNDFDPEGGPLEVVAVSSAAGGVAEVGPNGQSVRITVEPNTLTSFTASYDVIDDHENRTAAVIRVQVVPNGEANRPPVARPDSVRTQFETAISINAIENDSDPDGDPIRIESIAVQPENGIALVDSETGEVFYEPAVDFSGTDRFTYSLVDSFGARTTGEVLVGVMPPTERNRDPVATDDSFLTIATGDTIELPILDNDIDPDGDQLRIQRFDRPVLGELDIDQARTLLTYRAPISLDADETIVFEYQVTDRRGGRDSAFVTILVQATPPPADGAPIAVDDLVGPVESTTPLRVEVVANDRDPDHSLADLEVAVFDERLTVEGQTVVFDAPLVSETFPYQISDPDGNTSSALIIVEVSDPIPPVAVDDEFGPVSPGEQFSVDVLANDFDDDGLPGELELVSVDGIGAVIDEGQVRILAPESSTQYTYTIRDATDLEASATLSLLVTENRAPIVELGEFETDFETPIEIDIAPLASDPDGDVLTFACCESPRGGAPTVLNVGEGALLVLFEPEADFSGEAGFTFTVDDLGGNIVAGAVTIQVGEQPNRPPVAIDGQAELQVPRAEGAPISAVVDLVSLTEERDAGDRLSYEIVQAPELGLSASVIDTNSIEIVATDQSSAGETSLVWLVTDAAGASDQAEIAIVVGEPDNDPPEVSEVTAEIPAGNSTVVNLAEVTIDDDPNEILTWSIVATPPDGVTVTQTGDATVTIAAAVNASGADFDFEFTATDRLGATDSSVVVVRVLDPDQPLPTAVDDQASTLQGRAVDVPVLINDLDPIGQGLVIVEAGSSSDGLVTIKGDVIEFQPVESFFGDTSVAYTVRDAADVATRESSAFIEIEVVGRPDAPEAPVCSADSEVANLTWTAPAANGAAITDYIVFGDHGDRRETTGTSLQWDGLENGTEYRFRLQATNEAGTSVFSEWSVPCTPDIVPERPASPQVTPGDGYLDVSWTPPVNDGSPIIEYVLRIGGGNSQTTTDTNFRWTPLENGTDQTFQVAARNAKGLSEFSSASTPEHPSTTPEAPVIRATTRAALSGAEASGILQVNWDPVPVDRDGGDTVIEYIIERDDGVRATVGGANTSSYVWSGLENGRDYEFRVFAVNRDGESPPSDWSAAVVPCTVPGAVRSLAVERQDGSARITFAPPDDIGGCDLTRYDIWITGNTGSRITANPISNTHVAIVEFDGLTNGEVYSFDVKARNVIGAGPISTSNAVVPAGLPICGRAITLDEISRSGEQYSWGQANFNGGEGARYDIRFEGGGSGGQWFSVGNVTNHQSGLNNGSQHTVSIRAVTDIGSKNCGSVTFTSCPTIPPAPGAISHLIDESTGVVSFNWDPVTVPCASQPQVTDDFNVVYVTNVADTVCFANNTCIGAALPGLDPNKTGVQNGGVFDTTSSWTAPIPIISGTLDVSVYACYANLTGDCQFSASSISLPAMPPTGSVTISLGNPGFFSPGWGGTGSQCYPGADLLAFGGNPNQGCFEVVVDIRGMDFSTGTKSVHCYRTTNNDESPWFGDWAYYNNITGVQSNGVYSGCSFTQAGRAVLVVVNGSASDTPGRTIQVPPPGVPSNIIDPWPTGDPLPPLEPCLFDPNILCP